MKAVKTDLPRRVEKRYIVPSSDDFIRYISPFTERIRFSDNKTVQTIYFNNDNHFLPFDYTIKARRYMPTLSDNPQLDDSNYLIDIKTSDGNEKIKNRFEASLQELLQYLDGEFDQHLRPFTVVVYNRQHFRPRNNNRTRITIDDNLIYFYFQPGESKAIQIAQEEYPVIEVKEGGNDGNDDINNALKLAKAVPLISKKYRSFMRLNKFHEKLPDYGVIKDLTGYEIESKLSSDSEDVFQAMLDLFREEDSGFIMPKDYPYVHETSSINRYYRGSNGIYKATLKANMARLTIKGETQILDNKSGLTCILKRKENKGQRVTVWSPKLESDELLNELSRKRKVFWVQSPETTRLYHISLDKCQNEDRELKQVEVEYSGLYSSTPLNEGEIVSDIAHITDMLIDKFSELKPTTLTKEEWLGI